MRDLMLDLETFGLRPGCALRSIGAVMFEPDGDAIGERFYVNVEQKSCEDAGLIVNRDTVRWWDTQPQEARDAFLVDPQPLGAAILRFVTFFQNTGAVRIWSQGANYDEPLLTAVLDRMGIRQPWKFWNSRCTRTIYAAAGLDYNRQPRAGTHHNALDDAVHQAVCVQRAYRMLGLSHDKGDTL